MKNMLTVRSIGENRRQYLPILLEADPDEAMIDRYLEKGRMYGLDEDGKIVAVAVTVPLENNSCELKNIAVDPACQGRGLGTKLLREVIRAEAPRADKIYVGTTLPTEPFYLHSGFVYSHTLRNFFIDNYPEPIFEGDVQCIDMRYLVRSTAL